jgi:RNA polymerase sigma factor for flagellar operon FliA
MVASAKERQQLVDENLAFVRATAAKLKETLPREIEFEDLIQSGMEGLMDAAERYDRAYGVAFTTFAWYRVRGAMFDGIRKMGYPLRADKPVRFAERANAYLANLVDREAGERTRAPELEREVEDIADALAGVAAVFLAATELDPEAGRPDEAYEVRETRAELSRALASLPDKERTLLELYYLQEKSLEQAGAELGLSKSWASRLHARAVTLLHQALQPRDAPTATGPPKRRRARRR